MTEKKANVIIKSRGGERGSGVVMAVIFSGIVMASLGFMMTEVNTAVNNSRTISAKKEYKEFLTSLSHSVGHPDYCSDPALGLMGSVVSPPTRALNQKFSMRTGGMNLNYGKNTLVGGVKNGWVSPGGQFVVDDMYLLFGNQIATGMRRATTANFPIGKYEAKLVVVARLCKAPGCTPSGQYLTNAPNASGVEIYGDNSLDALGNLVNPAQAYSMKEYAVEIPLFVHVNESTNRVVSCFGQQSAAAYCENTNGIWNSAQPNVALRCEPHARCFMKLPDGGGACGNPRYDRILMGYVSIPPAPAVATYFCQWCNTRL